MKWLYLAQDSIYLQTVLDSAMKLRVESERYSYSKDITLSVLLICNYFTHYLRITRNIL